VNFKNIFNEGELIRNSVVANFATTAADGKTYQVDYYNLDVIISVGYRVKSLCGTQFRIWASSVLKEYMKKGFTMNDDLLRNNGGGVYFDELLEWIHDIRSSEKVIMKNTAAESTRTIPAYSQVYFIRISRRVINFEKKYRTFFESR